MEAKIFHFKGLGQLEFSFQGPWPMRFKGLAGSGSRLKMFGPGVG